MKSTLISTAAMIAFSLTSAWAGPITWNLVGPTSQLLGTSDKVVSTTGNVTLVFTGYVTNTGDVAASNSTTWLSPTSHTSALFAKNAGGDEIGLGIAADPTGDDEIYKNSFVQIDLAGLLAQKAISSIQLVIGSVQSSEGFNVWGSNTAGQAGTLLSSAGSAMDDIAFAVPGYGSYQYIAISAAAKNVLLDSFTASTAVPVGGAPEPGTLGLYLIAGIGLVAWKVAKLLRD